MSKKSRRFKFHELRQRFRLTATEKRVALFVIVAFMLGLITKCYRDAHPSPAPARPHSQTTTTETTVVNARDAAKRLPKTQEKLDLSDSATKQEQRQK